MPTPDEIVADTSVIADAVRVARELTRESSSLDKLLSDFEIPKGPADQVAFRDHQQIQVALDNVWTQAIDDDLVERLEAALRSLVEFVAERERFASDADDGGSHPPSVRAERFFRELSELLDAKTSKTSVSELVAWMSGSYKAFFRDGSLAQRAFDLGPELLVDGMINEASQHAAHDTPGEDPSDSQETRRPSEIAKGLPDLEGDGAPPKPWLAAGAHLGALSNVVGESYGFHVFHRNAINYGLIAEYRQEWHPGVYQAGQLVKTVPLAPGEKRSYKVSTSRKVSRASSTDSKIATTLESEGSSTSKDVQTIDQLLSSESTFGNDASYSGMGASVSMSVDSTAGEESKIHKENIKESTFKAAKKLNETRTVKIDVSESTDASVTTESELINPNNEISVTYLFYELGRRYRVFSRLRKVTPVIFVALEVPRPAELNATWVRRHEWLLRRYLLDDFFEEHLDSLHAREIEINDAAARRLEDRIAAEQALVENLRAQISANAIEIEEAEENLKEALAKASGSKRKRRRRVAAGKIAAQQSAADKGLEFEIEDDKELREELAAALRLINLLDAQLTEAAAAKEHALWLKDQFVSHLHDNILHYMEKIWQEVPPAQQLLAQYDRYVDWPALSETHLAEIRSDPQLSDHPALQVFPDESPPPSSLIDHVFEPATGDDRERLAEVADIASPIGYMGNYVMYPLRKENKVTAEMVKPYLNLDSGSVVDPDMTGAIDWVALKEALAHIEDGPAIGLSEPDFAALKRAVVSVTESQRVSEVVVVNSGEVFIEALPGTRPVLEGFKIAHRAIDVEQAAIAVERDALENFRIASLVAQGDSSDSDFDQSILVRGTDPEVEIPTDTGGSTNPDPD